MVKPILVLLLIKSVTATQAVRNQTHDLAAPISDSSSPDSPLRVSGQALFHEVFSKDVSAVRYDIDGEIRNISLKPVIAFDVSVSLLPEYDGGVKQEFITDYFFQRDILEPGMQFSMSGLTPGNDTGPYHGETPVRAAHAEAQVLFVQFADGSTFGTSPWGEGLKNDRKAQIELFRELLQAYKNGQGPGLSAAITDGLAKPNRPRAVDATLREINYDIASKGPETAVDKIRDYLSNAQSRETLLQPRP